MSELSYLEKLLDGVEVEWKSLGEIATKIYSGGTPDTKRKEYWENGTIPWMSSGEVNLKNIERTEKYITEAGLNNSSAKLVPRNSVVIALAGQGKTRGKVARIRIALATNQSLAALTFDEKKFSSDYVFHFLETQYESLRQISSGNSGRGGLNLQMISAYKIPIPCPDNPEKSLAIQSEIVRILDKFSELTAELTAELNMRKKQYNYYRDQLLRFKEGEVEWKTLGEIGDFTYGYAAKAMDSGDARFVRITDINKDGKLSKENPMYVELNEENEKYTLDKNDLLMARTGATFGKTMIFEEDYPAVYAGFLIKLNLNKTIINAKYYWHFAQSDFFWEQANKLVSGGGQPQFNANALKQVRVPIPYPSHPQKSLDEQGRIVDILDKFDAIAASITEGLPREIELRQKQYEYYRDLLLSFPKPETVSK
ncbi:restriction endonuclease subunit S [Escherichia coli]|uniref:restriction endonuclease subunit S n=1 Tax=Escherichia coli TaxID=562 RepID=UPI00184DDEC3|nr:restriction endonuclease subunit S [Escherichia coli]EFA7717707.1 restriction endonuclease subunit S [Escherichia coli]MBY7237264.1 restriction endonuclease subunit S [Escherichia coli]MBY7393152.1 restriction endonuclease subunit S [Escherichia coli]HAW2256103.1 restriction endonuclease subunit S [Escherichia coli]HBA3293504.1 restriction endonuclease subunit S [Escherichia coli]